METLAAPVLEPFWGPMTASVDWCEPNYVFPYLAEFWNCISNIPPLIVCLVALYWSRKKGKENAQGQTQTAQPPAFIVSYLFPLAVFLGSAIFHASLTYTGQLLDELPMVFGSVYFHYILSDSLIGKAFALFLLALASIIVTLMLTLRHSPLPLQIGWACVVVWLVIRCALATSKWKGIKNDRLFQSGFIMYLLGAICWVTDRHLCSHVQSLHLHAWWHLFSGFGTYLYIQYACELQFYRSLEKSRTKMMFGLLPFVQLASVGDSSGKNLQQ
jgi:dihydroceramidase